MGIYSDEIYKEQSKVIEDKIITIEITRDDSNIRKYNLEDVSKFIMKKFINVGQTYNDSDLTEKKALLGSIFASNLVWSYPGISNQQISESVRKMVPGGGNLVYSDSKK